jgi:ATP-binding cassette subfamily G (WHITE) protein 2 (PDR)
LITTEFISAKRSKGEVLIFPRGKVPFTKSRADEEAGNDDRATAANTVALTKTTTDVPPNIQKQTAIFQWSDVNYDIKIKKEPRRLLDQVDGWVKPGTLTALMVGDLFEFFTMSIVTDITGRFWCWKDYSIRCSCQSRDDGSCLW